MLYKDIQIESPFKDIQIGTILDYSGVYRNGEFIEGKAPIKEIIVRVSTFDKDKINYRPSTIYARLDNNKLIILGTQEQKDGIVTQELTRDFIQF